MKFVFVVYCMKLIVASGVITIILLAETVSVTLVYLSYFHFEPKHVLKFKQKPSDRRLKDTVL